MKPRPAAFFTNVWAGSAPLLVWALHFAVSYVMVAVMCANTVKQGAGEPDVLRWTLGVATVLAVAMLALMLWRSRAPTSQPPFAKFVRRVGATLALIAVVLTLVPLAMLPACATPLG